MAQQVVPQVAQQVAQKVAQTQISFAEAASSSAVGSAGELPQGAVTDQSVPLFPTNTITTTAGTAATTAATTTVSGKQRGRKNIIFGNE